MSNNTTTNFELLYSLFNEYVFQDAKNNIESLDYYFRTNPTTMDNPLVFELLNAIRNYSFESIDIPLFKSIFNKCGKSPQEADYILSEIIKWKKYDKNSILPSKDYLSEIGASAILRRISSEYKNDAVGFLKACKNANFYTADTNVISLVPWDEIDIQSILADNPNDFIPSRYDWINTSFNPYPGYEKGQMVLICAPPGVGKSLWLMSEALNMAMLGHRVVYWCLGDNKMKDFVIRMGAIYSGMTFAEVHQCVGEMYDEIKRVTRNTETGKSNLIISINAAKKVSAEDIVERSRAGNFDVIVVDYDGNLKGVEEGDSMYNTYGDVYAKLNELVLEQKLLFIAAQPKVGVWGSNVIEMQDIGESSKKQHTADMIITCGREIESPNHLHTFKIAKSRRGEEGIKAYTIRLANGRFKDLPKPLYDELKNIPDKRAYTEADIDSMINQYNITNYNINSRIQQAQQLQQQSLPNQVGGIGGNNMISISDPYQTNYAPPNPMITSNNVGSDSPF